jgi:tetratricopeptide (TPR) repeat protein
MKLPLSDSLSKSSTKRAWGILLLLGALSLVPYANSLGFDFVWDDRALILENPYIQDSRLLGEGLGSDFWRSPDYPERRRSFFRPLVTLSFFLDYSLWGKRPAGYHATNLLLHFINVLLVYACFSMLASRELAVASAALFAVHPIHTESVTWISGRTDLLTSALVLGSFFCYLTISGRSHAVLRSVAVGLLYILALLAKEVAIVFPGVTAFHLRWLSSPEDKARRVHRATLWSLLGIGFFYLIFRLQVLQMPLWVGAERPFWLLLFNLPRILSRYLLKLVFPLRLYAHDPLEWALPDQWPAVVLAILILFLAAFAVTWLGKRDRNALLGGVWLLLFLLPVLNAGTFTDVLVAERFLYLPSAGFCWIVASGYGLIRRTEVWRPGIQLAAVALILVSAVGTWHRNAVWRNEIVLFEEIHRTSPNFFLPHRALASAYLRHGMPEEAVKELGHVLERAPGDCGALNDLAVGYFDLGMEKRSGAILDTGFELTQRAIEVCPDSDVLHHTLGEYYLRQKNVENNVELALAEFQYALSLNPTRAAYHFEVGSILVELGRTKEAQPFLAEYIRLAPSGERRQQAIEWLEP